MHSRVVEFRMLQLVTNQIGDERQTVALIHWDGSQFRLAWNPHTITSAPYALRNDLSTVVDGILKTARSLASNPRPQLPNRIDAICPVREGRDGLIFWSPKNVGMTSNGLAHFGELVRMLGLRVHGERKTKHHDSGSRRDLNRWLSSMGDRIKAAMGGTERIQTGMHVHGLKEYNSPLSWQNGQWHHSFPVNLSTASSGSFVDRFQKELGRINVSVPSNDVGVMLAVYKSSPNTEAELSGIESFVRERSPNVEFMRAPLLGNELPFLEPLQSRIQHDVAVGM